MHAIVESALSEIANLLAMYEAHGVAIYNYTKPEPELKFGTAKQLWKKICKEGKRPFVEATFWRHSRAVLTIPRTVRMQKLVTPLSLAANGRSDVHHSLRSDKHEFTFDGDAMHVLVVWLEKCRTDPVFKICLKQN